MLKYIIYRVFFWVVTFRIAVRVVGQFKHLNFSNFTDTSLWMAFLGVFLFHWALIVLLIGSNKIKEFSVFFLYINFILFLYLLTLISGLIHFPAIVFLYMGIVSLGWFLYWPFKINKFPVRFVKEDILIVLWLIHSFFFFFKYNFNPSRGMSQDEYTFWAVASQNMINEGMLKAHLAGYAGGGLHPFGIPFLTALPLLIIKSIPLSGIFFMPIVVILGLFLFLNKIKNERWLFLFFLVALFVSFNNRSWMATLMYQLVYGEGISTVILLWFTYEIVNNNFNLQKYFLLGGFFIGLLALTKSPLALTFLPFLAVFLIKHKRDCSWQSVGSVIIIALIPSLVWSLYVNTFHISHYKPDLAFSKIIERLSAPNIHFLHLAFKHLWMNAKNFVFLGIYSLVLFILFSKKYLEAVPALCLLTGVILYYAYYYAYGSMGDYESFLRYIMPASLPMFYLGGVGLNNLMGAVENSKIAIGWKTVLMIGFTGLFVCKLF